MPTLTRFLGRNQGQAPTEIGDSECAKCQNFFLSGHSLKLRDGYELSFQDSGTPTAPVRGLHRAVITGAGVSPFWMWCVGETIRSDRTGAQATINTNASNLLTNMEFIEANGSVYILRDGAAGVLKSDGTLVGTVAHPDADTPLARTGIWHNQRLFLNEHPNTIATADQTSRLWFSDTNDPDIFRNQTSSSVETEGGLIKVGTGDGGHIRGLAALGSALLIFKDRTVDMLLGTSFTGSGAFRLLPVANVGCVSRRSIVQMENGVVFLDSDGLVRFFHGPSRKLYGGLGRPIEDLTRAITQLAGIVAFEYDRKYFISFPSGSTNDTSYALDLRLVAPYLGEESESNIPSGWSQITGLAWGAAYTTRVGTAKLLPYVADASSNAKVWKFLSSQTDDGAAISYAWISKAYGADAPTVVKSISEFTTLTRTVSAAVTHEAYANLVTSATATKSITPSSATHSVNTWKPGETVRGTALQVGISGSSSVGAEILATEWDWGPKRREPVDA